MDYSCRKFPPNYDGIYHILRKVVIFTEHHLRVVMKDVNNNLILKLQFSIYFPLLRKPLLPRNIPQKFLIGLFGKCRFFEPIISSNEVPIKSEISVNEMVLKEQIVKLKFN